MKEFVIRISWYDNRRNFKFKEHIFPTLSIAKMFKRWYRLGRGERIELYSRESGEPLRLDRNFKKLDKFV